MTKTKDENKKCEHDFIIRGFAYISIGHQIVAELECSKCGKNEWDSGKVRGNMGGEEND